LLKTIQQAENHKFLQGGGEMGRLTRNFDWSGTSVGSPENWPQSLRITVSNLLRSRFPMFLWWGQDMIQFYNDAYRPSMGVNGKHPNALGQKGVECWPEIWDIISPLHKQVQITGEATWSEDQLVPIYRNGKVEDVYWTFSYSSVLDDEGHHGGILVTCMETTGEVLGQKKLGESEARFRNIIEQAPVAIAMTNGEDFIFESINLPMLQMINQKSRQDVLGRRLKDVLPELVNQPVFDILLNVIQTGEPYQGIEVEAELANDGVLQRRYFNVTYSRVVNKDGVPSVLHVAIDVTKQVLDRRKTEESEAKLRSILNSAPTAMGVFVGPELIVENPNQLLIEVMEAGPDIEGKSFRKLLSGLVEEDQKFINLIDNVRTSGQPFEAQEVEVFFKTEKRTRYFNINFIPLRDENGEVYAVLDVSVDVTGQVATRRRLLEIESRFRNTVMQAPVAIAIFRGPGHIVEVANEEHLRLWGRRAEQVIGLPLFEALPEVAGHGLEELLSGVLRTGEPFYARELHFDLWRGGKLERVYLNFVYEALREEDESISGVIVVATEVTDEVLAGHRLATSEAKFRSLIEEAPFATALYTGPELTIDTINDAMLQLWDKPASVVGKTFEQALPELDGQPFADLLKEVYRTGVEYVAKAQSADIMIHGRLQRGWYNFNYKPIRNQGGEIYGIVHMAVDVTEQVLAQQKIIENETALATALEQVRLSKEAAELGTFDLDLNKGTMHWDDRCRTMFGISHKGPVTYEKDFVQGLHPDDRQRILTIIDKAFKKAETDGEYDVEYRTIGAEDGVERWVKAKGKVYFDDKDTPLRFIGSVLDITAQMTAMQKIEKTVEERTKELALANEALQRTNKELQRSNQNLEEFAYAASHDLKEPIRKIHYFTNHLKQQLSENLKDAQGRTFSRIENATERMGNLIDDLLLFSHVSQRPHETETINLKETVERVLEDLELDIAEKKAIIAVGKLPEVQGYRRQLQQLFQNLMSNALKYGNIDVVPRIDISATKFTENGSAYNLVVVKDNGIGFEQKYADKIFQMFARLHGKAEYSGTGVGLSIVKKVVENHNGFIKVESTPGEGSTFMIGLPA
jgi:PAS domain S-box-containing protein